MMHGYNSCVGESPPLPPNVTVIMCYIWWQRWDVTVTHDFDLTFIALQCIL